MKLEIEIGGRIRVVEYTSGETIAVVNGVPNDVEARLLRPGVLSLIVDGRAWRVVIEEDVNEPSVHIARERISYGLDDPRLLEARRARRWRGRAEDNQGINAGAPSAGAGGAR